METMAKNATDVRMIESIWALYMQSRTYTMELFV